MSRDEQIQWTIDLVNNLGRLGVPFQVLHHERDENLGGLEYANPEYPFIKPLMEEVRRGLGERWPILFDIAGLPEPISQRISLNRGFFSDAYLCRQARLRLSSTLASQRMQPAYTGGAAAESLPPEERSRPQRTPADHQ